MENNQTEFEQYLVEADKQVKEYIDQEMWHFTKEQRPTWWCKPRVFPGYVQTINIEDQYVLYRFFETGKIESPSSFRDQNNSLRIVVKPDCEPYLIFKLSRLDARPYYHGTTFPLVPGLLAILVTYFLDAGYTPLVDAKENRNG